MRLQDQLSEIISRSSADAVAVAFKDLTSGEELFILPDEPFHAASTMKVCVLMELFHQAEAGELSLDEPLLIRNEFSSIVDGSPYSIDQDDDSEQSLYGRLGEDSTLIELAQPMITHSSNLATNLLVDHLGAERISAFMTELGAPGLVVRRGVGDGKAYRLGLNNEVTARGLTAVMVKLAEGAVVSESASIAMIEILCGQVHRNSIPAGLPAGTRIANKTGWNSEACHDTAIVFPVGKGLYVLTVLTRGLDEKTTGQQIIAEISRRVFDACGSYQPVDFTRGSRGGSRGSQFGNSSSCDL